MIFNKDGLTKVKDAFIHDALMVVMERYNDSFHFCYIDHNNGLCLKFWGILTMDQIKDVIIHFKNDVCVNDITPMEFIDYDHRYDEDKPFTYVYF
jgi:hypothetical protein